MTQTPSSLQARRFRDILASVSTYGDDGDRCFNPRFAVSIETEDEQIDILICIECKHVAFIVGESSTMETLSREGRQNLIELHRELFPGSAPEPDY
ncbi:hypothetical protein EON80_20250 [bacterium]|nr:MAG: hypothetical protein EON80_20250 [bacterium]